MLHFATSDLLFLEVPEYGHIISHARQQLSSAVLGFLVDSILRLQTRALWTEVKSVQFIESCLAGVQI